MKNLQFDKKLFFILKTVGNCLKTVVIVIFSLKMLIFIDFPINSLKINIFYVNYMLLRSIAQHYFQKILNLPDLFELSLIIETKNPPQTLSCVHTTFKRSHRGQGYFWTILFGLFNGVVSLKKKHATKRHRYINCRKPDIHGSAVSKIRQKSSSNPILSPDSLFERPNHRS